MGEYRVIEDTTETGPVWIVMLYIGALASCAGIFYDHANHSYEEHDRKMEGSESRWCRHEDQEKCARCIYSSGEWAHFEKVPGLWERLHELPPELVTAFWKGGGHNSAGNKKPT